MPMNYAELFPLEDPGPRNNRKRKLPPLQAACLTTPGQWRIANQSLKRIGPPKWMYGPGWQRAFRERDGVYLIYLRWVGKKGEFLVAGGEDALKMILDATEIVLGPDEGAARAT
jgi:hypothetical protein